MDFLDANRNWGEKLGLTYPLLSDGQRAMSRAYESLNDDPEMAKGPRIGTYLRSKRSWFVIDKQGIIRYKRVGPLNPQLIQQKILPLVNELNR